MLPFLLTKKDRYVNLIPIVLLFLFVLQAISSMQEKSSTWDETHYFGLGRYLLKNRRWDVPGSILHPPLSFYLHSIPLLFLKLDDKVWEYSGYPEIKKERWFLGGADIKRGQILLGSSNYHPDNLLFLTRVPTVLLAALLGIYVFKWAKELYGKPSGSFALLFYTFSPNILAHSRLITPDISLTCFMFIATYYLWRYIIDPTNRNLVIAGICLGLALLSKYTALLLFPIYLLILLVVIPILKLRVKPTSLLIFAIGLFILTLGYGFHLKPFIEGILFQVEHARIGHSSFLMGMHSTEGWWYYFIIAFLIKTPIPLLILVPISIFFIRRSSLNEYFLIIPVLFIFSFFSFNHQCIGLRYILPIYPFLFVSISRLVNLRIKPLTCLLIPLSIWYVISSLSIYPHYLAYFNGIVRGPDNGYRYLVDSNLDWGQDLKGLKRYMTQKKIDRIRLSYFGTALPEWYDISYDWLPSCVLKRPEDQKGLDLPIKGKIAISATNLQGVYLRHDYFGWLRGHKPIDKIGYSIFIYDIK